MCEISNCEVEQSFVIRDRIPLRLVDSYTRAHHSPPADCGYFCGFALQKLFQHGPLGISEVRASRLEVYQAREAFLRQRGVIGSGPPILTHRHRYALDPGAAPNFLSFLSLPQHYTYEVANRITLTNRTSRSNLCQQIFAYIGQRSSTILMQNRFGLMLAHTMPGGKAHWISILGISGPPPGQNFLVYDPCGAGGYFDAVRWIDRERMEDFYGAFQQNYIISPFGAPIMQ
jgi:hypothetical protein